MSKLKLRQVKNLILQLSEISFKDRELQGSLLLSESSLSWIKELADNQVIGATCEIQGRHTAIKSIKSNALGQIAKLNIKSSDYQGVDAFFAENLSELISFGGNQSKVPDCFLLYNDGECFLYPDQIPQDAETLHYIQITELVQLLNEHADYCEPNKLIFLQKSKLILTVPSYDMDLLKYELDGFVLLKRTLSDTNHQAEKSSILKEALVSLLSSVEVKHRFKFLVSNFSEFSVRFEEGYRLFAASFSFEKVRQEYEEQYREYVSKLNAAFSEVANKLLAIPITLFVSFSQIVPLSTITDPVTAQITIVKNVGVVLVSLLMFLYVRELTVMQRSTLCAVHSEYTELMKRFKSSYPTGYTRIEELHLKLDERYKYLKRGLLFADITAFIGLLVTLYIFKFWL